MPKVVGVLGTGGVGQALANGLVDLGYDVIMGSRSVKSVDNWSGKVTTFADAAGKADIIVLAVKGLAASDVVTSIKESLGGKIVIDTTNPLTDAPPEDGVLGVFTTFSDSLMERLQKLAPKAHFVKAFNSVGSGNMINPVYPEAKPSMFICGDDEESKKEVSEIIEKLGWIVEDMGSVKAARAIEPLCILWCIPGMNSNQWTHAFKLLKK